LFICYIIIFISFHTLIILLFSLLCNFYFSNKPYELYKKILEIPGEVIELGVFKGASLIQFAIFRELLESECSRNIIGFDVFGEFPNGKAFASDEEFVKEWKKDFDNDFLQQADLYKSFSCRNIGNIELVKGDICQTLPEYIERHPETRIALLHIDTDIYEPTKIGLELLFDRVVKGGVIIFDDYIGVEGGTVAIDNYLKNQSNPYTIKKLRGCHRKPSYIIK
ncbi:MAG: hypothetical protein HFF62_07590, partial [Oscillospiraceae bacterium]|nr:hypothetical protein [Oscillospiraceae bacterium]